MRFSRKPPARCARCIMDTITRLLLVSLCGLVGSEPLGRLLQRRRDAFEVYAQEFSREYEPYMFAAIPLHAPVPVLRVVSRAPLQPPRPRDPLASAASARASYVRPWVHNYKEQTQQYAPPAHRYEEPARLYPESVRPYVKPARPYAEQDYEASAYGYRQEYARPAYYQKPHQQVAPAFEYAMEYDSYAPQLSTIQPSPHPQLTYAIAPYDSVAYSASQEAAPTVLYARPKPSGGFTYRRVPDAPKPPKKKPSASLKEKDPQYIFKIHKYKIVKDDLI